MDFFLGTSFDDFVVPKGEELSDRLPSPGSWSEWGVRPASSFEFSSPCKCFADTEYPLEVETDCGDDFLQDEGLMKSSSHQKNQCSSLCGSGELADESAKLTALSSDQSCSQPECLSGVEQLDDLFLNSLLEEFPINQIVLDSVPFSPTMQCGAMPTGNRSAEMGLDSQEFSCNEHLAENASYRKIQVPSMSECHASSSSPFGSVPKEIPHEKVKSFSDSEEIIEDKFVEETSLEEFVLHNLEMVMRQMTDETRMCFRDAFYRLAENSRQQALMQNEVGELPPSTSSMTMTKGEKAMESETNSIDRTVANLVFNNTELHARNSPASASASSTLDFSKTIMPPSYISNQHLHGIHHYGFPHSNMEVTFFSQINSLAGMLT